MDWRQTIETVTIYHKKLRNYQGLGYELIRLGNSKLNIKVFFEGDSLVYDLHLRAEVEWPPTCIRKLETTQVNNRIEEEILFNMLAVR